MKDTNDKKGLITDQLGVPSPCTVNQGRNIRITIPWCKYYHKNYIVRGPVQ